MISPERLLESFDVPRPPDSLRARSLAAARAATAKSKTRSDSWMRLWQARAARLAWAAAVAGLVLAHVVLSVPARSTTAHGGSALLLAGAGPDPELAATVTLPRLRSNRLPQLDVSLKTVSAAPAGGITPRSDDHDA
ncbi:MAG TPA: hypothetical protein PLM61_01345 [Thermoanaerobaculales bacterium]|nr:hypothetical protein [Thermoanaerobaculales bacterium]